MSIDTKHRPAGALGILVVVMAAAGCASPAAVTQPPAPAGTPVPRIETSATPAATGDTGGGPTVAEIARLQAVVAADPTDADALRELGFALSQRVRETADPSLYESALAAFEAALRLEPDDALALVGRAGVELGRHDFEAALVTARQAIELSPTLVSAHAAVVDALVELGRYEEADAAAGEMLALRADITTLARVSYLAELRGQLTAALAAMRLAAESPGLAPENDAYVKTLLANLLVYNGDTAAAEAVYEAALALVPDHAPSIAGQGRIAVGAGELDVAIARFERAAAIIPLPEYVIALGEAQAAAGRVDDASASFDLARAEIELFRAAGVAVDVELAVFEADHGDPAAALEYATAAHAATPTVRAADAVAWALHRLGRDEEAAAFVDEALRLGSIDPLIRYHAGAISLALGDETAAREHLLVALRTDPGFSATGADEARRLLALLD